MMRHNVTPGPQIVRPSTASMQVAETSTAPSTFQETPSLALTHTAVSPCCSSLCPPENWWLKEFLTLVYRILARNRSRSYHHTRRSTYINIWEGSSQSGYTAGQAALARKTACSTSKMTRSRDARHSLHSLQPHHQPRKMPQTASTRVKATDNSCRLVKLNDKSIVRFWLHGLLVQVVVSRLRG